MKLKISIGEPEPQSFSEAYFVKVKAVSVKGAEAYIPFGPFYKDSDENDMGNLIGTLNRMKEAFPEKLTFMDEYLNIEGFLGWFDSEYPKEQSLFYEYPDFEGDFVEYEAVANVALRYGGASGLWPLDPALNYSRPMRFTEYSVTFYDKEGRKYNAFVSLDE